MQTQQRKHWQRWIVRSILALGLLIALFGPLTTVSAQGASDPSCPQVPTTVDPAHFTDQELAVYGLPKFQVGSDRAA